MKIIAVAILSILIFLVGFIAGMHTGAPLTFLGHYLSGVIKDEIAKARKED